MEDPPFRRVFDHRSEVLADRVRRDQDALIPRAVQQAVADIVEHAPWPKEGPAWWESRADALYRALIRAEDIQTFRRWLLTRASLVHLAILDAHFARLYTCILDTAPGHPWHDQVASALESSSDPLLCARLAMETSLKSQE